jgi:hypothetical protein
MTTPRKIEERYLTEYSTTHDAYLHYDTFSWQVGAVLVAAVFVFLGFLLQPDVTDPRLFAAGSREKQFGVKSLFLTFVLEFGRNPVNGTATPNPI